MSDIQVVSYVPNYLPVSDAKITWDDIVIKSASSNYRVTDGGYVDCNLNWTLTVDLEFSADNGVRYSSRWSDNRQKFDESPWACDQDWTVNYTGDEAKKMLGPNPGQLNGDRYTMIHAQFLNEYTRIVAAINGRVAAMQNGLPLPAPDLTDRRTLAVPVLFVHGIGDSAERWGVGYARRDCGNPVIMDDVELSLNGTLKHNWPLMSARFSASCADGTVMRKWGWGYIPEIPGNKFNPSGSELWFSERPKFEFKKNLAANVFEAAWALPIESIVKPKEADKVASLDVELVALLEHPAISKGEATKKTVFFDEKWWTLVRKDISFQDILNGMTYAPPVAQEVWQELTEVPLDLTNGQSLPNAKENSLVRGYADGTAPDILARIEHLDRRYDWKNPAAGINRNGVYFYSAWDANKERLGSVPAPWDPYAYGEYLYASSYGIGSFSNYYGKSQARQLYDRISEILTLHYGEGWKTNPDAKIDVVAHSQGGLILRDMLIHAKDANLPKENRYQTALIPMPQGLEHPGAHIRKVVTLDSPHFGSAYAEDLATLQTPNSAYTAIGNLKEMITTSQVLRERSPVNLSNFRLPASGALAGAGCAVGEMTLGAASGGGIAGVGCLLGGGAGVAAAFGTDVDWSISGKALGPIDIKFYVDGPGPLDKTVTNSISLMENQDVVQKNLVDAQRVSRHLAPTSRWIFDLKKGGYPLLPGTTTPVRMLPLYTAGLPTFRSDISSELYRNLDKFCTDMDKDWKTQWFKVCDLSSKLLFGVAAGNLLDDSKLSKFFEQYDAQWLTKSDMVVEATSQKMMDGADFSPENDKLKGYFEEPREYLLQRQFGNGHATEVAHVGISVEERMDEYEFKLARPGAARMGPDIYAALYGGDFVLKGIQPLPPHARELTLPEVVSIPAGLAAPRAGIQEITATGDFAVSELGTDPMVHGIGVSSGGTLQVAAFYDRRQGTFLWTKPLGPFLGNQVLALGNSSQPSGIALMRAGHSWTATVTFQDGSSRTGSFLYPLGGVAQVGVLSSEAGRNQATLPAVLLGTVNAAPPAELEAERPWQLKTFVRESSTEANLSRAQFVLVNQDTRSLPKSSLEYWFTADPARNPVVEAGRLPVGAQWSVVHARDDQYKIVMTLPNGLPAKGLYPDAQGVDFRIRYSDWKGRWNRGDWSSDHNVGLAAPTEHIVVRGSDGTVLAGQEPPLRWEGRAKAQVVGWDDGVTGPNEVKPVFRVFNAGSLPLKNFSVRWYVQVPAGQTLILERWQTEEVRVATRDLGNGRWEVEARFDKFILYPSQFSDVVKIGMHLKDYAPWDRSDNPSQATATEGELNRVLVLDNQGARIWGDVPVFGAQLPVVVVPEEPKPPVTGTSSALEILIRESTPGDQIYARPMVRVRNAGTTTATGFQLGLWFDAPAGTTPLLDAAWYAPYCNVSMSAASVGYKLTYACPGAILKPGEIWPDQTGSVVGIHLPGYPQWDRSTSWSLSGLTAQEMPTDKMTLESQVGEILKGTRP